MFYTLSKALLFLLQPMVWIAILCIAAVITRRRRLKRSLLITSIGLFLVFGNPLLFAEVMSWWEVPNQGQDTRAEYAVILGGYADFNTAERSIEFNEAADRLTAGLSLYKAGQVKTLVLSSGVTFQEELGPTEADISSDWLLSVGVPEEGLILETQSRNTHENALYTAAMLIEGAPELPHIILITSAFHMKRAQACFEHQGFSVTPYPVDYKSLLHHNQWSSGILPRFQTVIDWQILLKEWVGILVYKTTGFI
jgi:uncharacterized SAM-binding protein YcdF (DUF218 family)